MKTWTMSTSQSRQASTSAFTERASPQIFASRPSFLMAVTVSFSAFDDAGNPASITWTPISESWRAISSFCSNVNAIPGSLFSIAERGVKNSYCFVCVAIDKEDDPPQNPCEQSYTHYEYADYLKKSCTTPKSADFMSAKTGHITIRLIRNLPYISSAVPRLNSAW